MRRVFNFSGGKSSALACLLSDPTEDDIILFDDTGREHPLTYKFISDFEKHEGLKVHTAAYTHKKSPGLIGFDAMTSHKTYLPNRVKRICREELKINVTKRYLRSIGIKPSEPFEQIIGFRADEEHRVKRFKPTWKKVITRFPLYEFGYNKAMVNEYWAKKPYTLEIPSILGNCDLCFLKGKDAIIRILQQYPELAEKWIKDEEETTKRRREKSQYFPDISYRQLLNLANSQKTLFHETGGGLELILPAYNCSCTNY